MIHLRFTYKQQIHRQFRKNSAKLAKYLVIFGLLVAQLPFNLLTVNAKKADKGNNSEIPQIGAGTLTDANYYDPGTIITAGTTPSRTENLPQTRTGFTISSSQLTDIQGINFKVKFPDGTYSGNYNVEANEEHADSGPANNYVSQMYLFNQGITAIEFTYSGVKNFTVKTYDYNELQGLYPPKVYGTGLASPPAEIEYKEKLFNSLGFNIITREEWGAPTDSIWQPQVVKVNRIVIHHTATSVDMANPANTVRAIYNYHTVTLDWGDIGYNYLIDPYGNLYEGRAGGNGAIGAHAVPNSGSIGIAILGNYSTQAPTQASLDTMIRLVAALSNLNDFTLNVGSSLLGHRDVNPTACPGQMLYDRLTDIRNAAENLKLQTSRVKEAVGVARTMVAEQYTQINNIAQVLVNFDSVDANMKEKLLSTSRGAIRTDQLKGNGILFVDNSRVKEFIAETLLSAPEAKIQPNYIYKTAGWNNTDPNRAVPTDYDPTIHWYFEKTKLPEAWKQLGGCAGNTNCEGSSSIRVAVVDTGVAYENYDYDTGSHFIITNFGGLSMDTPDVTTSASYANPNGIYNEGLDRRYQLAPELSQAHFVTGTNSAYDAGQDYLCSLRYLFSLSPNPTSTQCTAKESEKIWHANDDQGHGTFVTTIIAGRTGDAAPNKVVGIASNVTIIPIKVFFPNDDSLGTYKGTSNSLLVNWGIKHAVDQGAKVINLSLEGPAPDTYVEDAVNYAYTRGVNVVAAAGNDNDFIANYSPANLPNVITVGASDNNNNRANYSNYGPELDIVAPVGNSIGTLPIPQLASQNYTCQAVTPPTQPYCSIESSGNLFTQFTDASSPPTAAGTSFAAPQVSGEIALMLSLNPGLSPTQVYNHLILSTSDLGSPGYDSQFGYGLIDYSKTIYGVLNSFNPENWYASGPGNWNVSKSKSLTSGDFDNDGKKDVAVLYDYGNNNMGIWVFKSGNNNFTSQSWYVSGVNNWDVAKSKAFTSGDFNNDGKADIAILYDYGNNNMGIWVFIAGSNTFTPYLWFLSGPNNWDVAKSKAFTSGDFDNDGKADIGIMYDYGNNNMGIWVFNTVNNNFTKKLWYLSGPNNWNVTRSKAVKAADFTGDGKADIGIMYDYGSNNMGLWVFTAGSGSFTPSSWYVSGPNNWNITQSKMFDAADYNGDGKADLSIVYDYGSNNMGVLTFKALTSSFKPEIWYLSGPNNWDIAKSKYITSGDYNNDGKADATMMYDYGNNNMVLWVFKSFFH